MGSRGSPVAVTCQHPCYRYPHGHQAQLGIVLHTICCHGALEPPPVDLGGRRFCSQSRPSPSPPQRSCPPGIHMHTAQPAASTLGHPGLGLWVTSGPSHLEES